MVPYNTLVPVFVLTGFLGSGKTTLLNRLLHHPSLADAAVLINEFGEVGIDHQLVETIDETTVLLDSGWTVMDAEMQQLLDGLKRTGKTTAQKKIGSWDYTIDIAG